jgi:hypothetical protein
VVRTVRTRESDGLCPLRMVQPFIAGLSIVPSESYTIVVLFSVFVAVCFSSMAFGLHLFLWWRVLWMCVIEYLFCLLFLVLLRS